MTYQSYVDRGQFYVLPQPFQMGYHHFPAQSINWEQGQYVYLLYLIGSSDIHLILNFTITCNQVFICKLFALSLVHFTSSATYLNISSGQKFSLACQWCSLSVHSNLNHQSLLSHFCSRNVLRLLLNARTPPSILGGVGNY